MLPHQRRLRISKCEMNNRKEGCYAAALALRLGLHWNEYKDQIDNGEDSTYLTDNGLEVLLRGVLGLRGHRDRLENVCKGR